MNPADDGDFIAAETGAKRPSRRHWGRWALLAIVGLLLASGAAAWLLRKPIAEAILGNWCGKRALVCTAHFDRLGFSGAELEGVTISGGGARAFDAERIEVALNWPGFLKPQVTAVAADQPVLHGRLAEGRLGLNGLERLMSSGGTSGGGTLPEIDIRDGRIVIATSAGDVSANVEASGRFPQSGHASLTLEPADLNEPQGYIRWSGGGAHFSAEKGRIEGEANITLEEVRTDDFTITDAALTANLNGGASQKAPALLVWEARAQEAAGADFAVAGLSLSGRAKVDGLAGFSSEAILSALTEADIQLNSEAAQWTDYAFGAVQAEASLRGRDGAFSGPVGIRLSDAALPQGSAQAVEVSGDLGWSREQGAGFSGPVGISGASLSGDFLSGTLAKLTFPPPLTAHGQSLQAVLKRALARFDVQARVRLAYADRAVRIDAQDAASLTGESGLKLNVTSPAGMPWLRLGDDGIHLAGDLAMQDGGAPQLSARVQALDAGDGGFLLKTDQVKIAPWTADGLRFGADISSSNVQTGADGLSLTAEGSLRLSGPVFGLKLDDSRLSGGLQVKQEVNGLLVEPLGRPCLSFATKGVGLGGVAFQPSDLKLCPVNGAYMKPGKGGASGVAVLGDVAWPFASKSASGTLGLKDAKLSWIARNGFTFRISAPSLSLPLQIDDRTLTIDALDPDVDISTTSGRAPALSTMLKDVVLGGTLVPANVSAERVALDGEIGSGGLSGDLTGDSVLIRDFRDDPIYQPLLSDLTARMDEWQLALSGPLRLQANDTPIADISADINVLSLEGSAQVSTRPLVFTKGGLQPVMISERLRGVYTDAVGQMEAVADVTISSGKLAGTADVTAKDFGFQTTRLGRVSNVNGSVHFADLFSLTTDPSQVLTIGGMNPGVPLKDGRIAFGFFEGKVLDVASAAFPFAGGTLALSPFQWTLGGEDQHLEVTAKAIELKELVNTLKLSSIEAEGTVSGSFPIDIERNKVLIQNARLFADQGGGRLAYLGDAADSAAKSDANVRLAFEALKDFDFTVLEVGLNGNIADRVQITLKLAGKSRNDIAYGSNANIVRGQPFEFNIAIDSALAELFRSSQFYTNQQKVTDFVVKEVLTDRGLKPAEDE